jgi:hypothetical protein
MRGQILECESQVPRIPIDQDLAWWCEFILPIMRSVSGLTFAADFVEEIEDEADLAHSSSLS